MTKVSIQTLGSFGDVMPFVSVAHYLKELGADVSILSPSDYSGAIEARGIKAEAVEGFTLAAWDEEAEQRGTLKNPFNFFRDWDEMVAPYVDRTVEASLKAAEGAEVILANSICAPAQMVAEYYDIPFILNAHQPAISATRDYPCAMLWKPGMPSFLNKAGYAMVWGAQRAMEKALSGHRRRLGLRAPHNLGASRGTPRTDMVRLTTVSPFLIPDAPSDWQPYDMLKPYPSLVPESGAALPPDIEAFLQAGAPPVFIGLGSMDVEAYAADLRVILDAIEGRGRRAILSAGLAKKLDGPVGDQHVIVGQVPHDRIFPKCAAILHHGGAGTLDTALRAGVPQIIMPRHLDQFWHADALWRGGVAPKPLKRGQVTHADIETALAFALSEEARAFAKQVADPLLSRNGAKEVAEFTLSRIRSGPQSVR
ncbi:glycosyltransferase [Ponticaulis sp.]|uniref:glycosyltransferase n=1 Tax=Ponticaulis sp. TaxID=2020902 RepID=UPI0026298D1A|nr:glycosyltransferase [Ponticaulis sp.]MDF1679603.1 glycosyltransferase [Ponticaulis sp.]